MELPGIAKFLTAILIAMIAMILCIVFLIVTEDGKPREKEAYSNINSYQVIPSKKQVCVPGRA